MRIACTPPHQGAKERNIGVDIAKIVAIYFVVAIHSCNQFTIDHTNLPLVWVASFFSSITLSCIDLFAIATGYLCLTSSCKYSRIVNLWISVVFWGVSMLVICDTVLGFDVSWKYYINAVFPILRNQYWFFTSYFMLFVFMPLINKSIVNISKKEFDRLLLGMIIFMGIYSWIGRDVFNLKQGYSFVWLLSMYLVGGYIRLYNPIKLKISRCFIIALGLAFLPCVRQFLSMLVGFRIPGDRFVLASYVSPFTIGVALFIFAGCSQIKIRNKIIVKLIRAASATTFGIYLIHVQPFVWRQIWLPSMHKIVVQSVAGYIIWAFAIPVITFLIMALFECLRLKLFDMIGLKKVLSRIDEAFPRDANGYMNVS